MRHASSFACAALMVLGFLLAPRTARADDILIYAKFDTLDPSLSGNEAAAEAEEILEGLGHTVTVIASLTPTLPADLSVFDTIWVIQLPSISGLDETRLRDFVVAGGGLYLTGDNTPCCVGVDQSIDDIVGFNFHSPPSPSFSSVAPAGGPIFNPSTTDTFGITSTPNAIAQWETLGPGVITGARPERIVFTDASGRAAAAAFAPEDFDRSAGCIYVAMDLSFWLDVVAPTQDLSPLTQNIERFLESCGDSDHDGISDAGEPGFGTDPADPDTDDDGLCDSWASVAGVCVVGDLIYEDFDMDGMINPRDADDDGDGIPTRFELAAEGTAPDVDGDDIAAYYDRDSDGNFILDEEEGPGDYDGDGIPAIVDEGDEPTECMSDSECVAPLMCNLAVGYCHSAPAVPPDAGTATADAGTAAGADAGPRADAAGLDAGTRFDGGTTTPPSGDEGGCGCHAVRTRTRHESIGIVAVAFLFALASNMRRRRRRESSSKARCSP